MDLQRLDHQVIELIAELLKDCQQDNTLFDYDANWCLNNDQTPFLQTNYSKTFQYSQTMFDMEMAGTKPADI